MSCSRGHRWSSVVISGHQWPSAVFSDHQWSSVAITDALTCSMVRRSDGSLRSNALHSSLASADAGQLAKLTCSMVISGHQRSSAVNSGHQWSSAVISGQQRSTVVISGHQL